MYVGDLIFNVQGLLSIQKKIDIDFNPIFNKKQMSIHKTIADQICTKLNCASNN
jgi:hypothetical protein